MCFLSRHFHRPYQIYQQFDKALSILFEPEAPQDRVLRKYMDIGAYDLSIDDGKEQLQLTTQQAWSSIVQCGTTIVMSVVMAQRAYQKEYKCPCCDCWNKLKENYGQSRVDWCAFDFYLEPWFSYTVSRSCKRHLRVTRARQKFFQRVGTNEAETTPIPKCERDLICNIHLKRDVSTTSPFKV